MTLHVVGIGADGWPGLTDSARRLVRGARVLLGSPRQLDLVPDDPDQRRLLWPSPLRAGLPRLLDDLHAELAAGDVVALASGDPLVAGIGATLIDQLGADDVEVVPAVSSVALARARLGWDAATVTVVRDPATAVRHLAEGRRILVLSTDGSTPGVLATQFAAAGFGDSRFTILADLGAATEQMAQTTAARWSGEAPPLHVLAIECHGQTRLGLIAGLPDEAFENDGQLTKRDIRASALARLAPQPGQLLWDVGAGAGSVAIEWSRADSGCRAIAVERSLERSERIARNAKNLGVPGVEVETGIAPGCLAELPTPDAIFIGGGVTADELVDVCWRALPSGGRLVAHAVTLESEAVLHRHYTELGGELTRLSVEHASTLGRFTAWQPSRAVTQWAVVKP